MEAGFFYRLFNGTLYIVVSVDDQLLAAEQHAGVGYAAYLAHGGFNGAGAARAIHAADLPAKGPGAAPIAFLSRVGLIARAAVAVTATACRIRRHGRSSMNRKGEWTGLTNLAQRFCCGVAGTRFAAATGVMLMHMTSGV